MDLVNTIGSLPYWAANTTEYGAGSFHAGSAVVITGESAPGTIDNTAIQTWLKGKLAAGTLGPISDQAIYTIFYPSSTTITQSSAAGTASSCQQFGGYHDDFAYSSTVHISYAVIPECAELNNQVGVDAVTAGASHEWIEASTDPHPHADSAYFMVGADYLAWALAMGATENGDLCAIGIGQNYYRPAGYGHVIQRGWSNAAAAAGNTDPCVPAVAETPYFNAGAVTNDSVSVYFSPTKGVKVANGSSKTIDVQVWSTGDVGDIHVGVVDMKAATAATGQEAASAINTFSWDGGTTAAAWKASYSGVAHNGDTLHLTITNVKATNDFVPGTFVIVSHVGVKDPVKGYPQSNWWPGLAMN
jgi:hypothetical protein